MNFLFDSKGKHIANENNGQLYSPHGSNIGHYMKNHGFYIDMHGRYLGEVVLKNRLLYKINNGYESTSFGSYGNYGNIGNYGNPVNHGNIGMVGGYRDIDKNKLV